MLKFDPKKYLNTNPKSETTGIVNTTEVFVSNTDYEKVKSVAKQLKHAGIDITSSYENWIKIGFAFADAFGSLGEELFHIVSGNYPKYEQQKCTKQYQRCLHSKNSGATLGTFFHLAKEAGVTTQPSPTIPVKASNQKVQKDNSKEFKTKESLPALASSIYEQLAKFLKQVIQHAQNDQDRDLLLLGSITAISSCLPNIQGVYDQYTIYPNLFLFVTAPASSGKGRINLCRKLVYPIHQRKKEITETLLAQYEVELEEYLDLKKKQKGDPMIKPEKPKEQLLFIPANSSATGAFELLANNQGEGLIFETEGDTLAQVFKTEYGNYSDGFRKAFHHEQISFYRRTGSEYVDIPCPKLSTVLTGTPDQVLSLMPDTENGLFSRFMFYTMKRQKQWRNVFAKTEETSLDEVFDKLGDQFLNYHQVLENTPYKININLQPYQITQFNVFFSEQYERFLFLQKSGLEASLFRLGLICFRLIMILTIFRRLDQEKISKELFCADKDFETAIALVKVLLLHTEEIFLYLPNPKQLIPKQKNRKELFLEALPDSFTTITYKEIAESLNIPEKTAEGYITSFVNKRYIQRIGKGNYLNEYKSTTSEQACGV